VMLLAMCAWHPRIWGQRRVLGVRWGGLVRPAVTHGLCEACAAHVRDELARECSDGTKVNRAA